MSKVTHNNERESDKHHGGGPAGALGKPVEKAKNFKGTLKRVLAYLKPHTAKLIVVFVFAIASTTFTIASPKVISKAMNSMSNSFMARTILQQLTSAQDKIYDQLQSQAIVSQATQVNSLTPQQASALQQFLNLPRLDTVTSNDQKAYICEQILQLSAQMPSSQDMPQNITFTQAQIDEAINAIRETGGNFNYTYIGHIILILIGMYILSSIFQFIMQFIMASVAQITVYDMRKDVDHKLSRLPLKYFDGRTHGEILSRVTNDIDTISTTLQQSLTQLITSLISILGYIIMMLTISSMLTLVVLGTLPLYILSTVLIAKKSQKHFAAQQKELGILSGHVEEMYAGHKVIKAFGRESQSIDKFTDINNRLHKAGWKAQFISGIMFPLMNFVSNIGYVTISIVGGIWMTKSILNLGDITAFIQYSRSFTMPIVQTANIANIIQSTVACAERVFEVLDEKEETPDSANAKYIEAPKGEVSFKNVSFRYNKETPLIDNMNIDVREGHTIAIVGPTGAGKTTLVNLLMRFYEIDGGDITFDNINIRDMKRSELRGMIGMVLQDTWLFNGTVKENIAYGRKDATEEEIINASKAAQADSFIRALPDGYNTMLNEEISNISQGQKQLLTIARAIIARPTVLILDEATSNIDTRTELLIQKAMSNLMEDKTSFVIAHRLSTIRDAELILVMNHGKVVEQGNHNELLDKGGFYAELYNSQFTGASA